ncbi:glycosyltransferase family 2 protein [Acaryochloris sp. IP29b_bin.137]|uniref:glycosyltransferase family 2 protein n=1 Tax=Acaryochloris sp. IP29b_bin.137 TaxID=2969217 RepID=UPI002607D7DA|nr:glycosyltransferase family 2 protein [Acaryochloris sp. IP29b_bin.137]
MRVPQTDWDDVLVIIPVLNEEETIGTVISSLQKLGLRQIRVVDNGSCDRTADTAQTAGAEVLSEPIPGYGRACWKGMQNIPEHIYWILFCDGDGSDELSVLPAFFAQRQDCDLILGNRRARPDSRAAMTPVQNWGNGLATTLIRWGWGHPFQDLGPLRLIRRARLEQLNMQDRGFGWTVEMQAKAAEYQLRTCEIPQGYRPRQGGRSKISGTIKGSIQAGSVILSTLVILYGQHLQLLYAKSPLQKFSVWLSAILLMAGCAMIVPYGDFTQLGMVPPFWRGVSVMGLGFVVSWLLPQVSKMWFWTVAIATRCILLAMAPGNDIWRYLWEGRLQNLGISPFALAPTAPELAPLRTEWWSLINNADVSAIYPPITQLGFRGLAVISTSVLLFKVAFIAADLGVCWLLQRRFGCLKALIYAWNPLVIYAFAGGAHYDSWFILPLVWAWLCLDTQPRKAALTLAGLGLLGVSIATKWISLPIIAYVAWSFLKQREWTWASISVLLPVLPMLISALPFCALTSCPLIPTRSAFVTRGRSAEFLPIGSLLSAPEWHNAILLIPLAIALLFLLWRTTQVGDFTESYLGTLLLLSPVVHAWYFTWLVPFAVASRNWGTRLVSLSAFVYFALPHRESLGASHWLLTPSERLWLWAPFVLGWLWTRFVQRSQPLFKASPGISQ